MFFISGVEETRKSYRAEVLRGKRNFFSFEFISQKSIIKPDIVSDENTVLKRLKNLVFYLPECRRSLNIFRPNACEKFYFFWNVGLGIKKGMKCPDELVIFNSEDPYFYDSVIK